MTIHRRLVLLLHVLGTAYGQRIMINGQLSTRPYILHVAASLPIVIGPYLMRCEPLHAPSDAQSDWERAIFPAKSLYVRAEPDSPFRPLVFCAPAGPANDSGERCHGKWDAVVPQGVCPQEVFRATGCTPSFLSTRRTCVHLPLKRRDNARRKLTRNELDALHARPVLIEQ